MIPLLITFALATKPPLSVPDHATQVCVAELCNWVVSVETDDQPGDAFTVCWWRWSEDGVLLTTTPCLTVIMEPS